MSNIFEIMDLYLPYILFGMAGIILLLFILTIVNIVQNRKLKKKYNQFMMGKDAASLEDNLIKKISEIEELIASNENNKNDIEFLSYNMKQCFQKFGMVKYDAFHEMGGKLSFSLALLTKENNGFVLNAMHSREGCYTYIKEIIAGNSLILLSEEEKEALEVAMGINNEKEVESER